MKCAKKGCNGDLDFIGYASMGSSHSNYYKCDKCGNVYEIYDRNEGDKEKYILEVTGCKCTAYDWDKKRVCDSWLCKHGQANYRYERKECQWRKEWKQSSPVPHKQSEK